MLKRLCFSQFLFWLMVLPEAIFGQKHDEFEQEYSLVEDISYRDGDELTDYMKERCRLDVYYPMGVRDYCTIVWFHGGGLTSGNRTIPAELKGKGVGVVRTLPRSDPLLPHNGLS